MAPAGGVTFRRAKGKQWGGVKGNSWASRTRAKILAVIGEAGLYGLSQTEITEATKGVEGRNKPEMKWGVTGVYLSHALFGLLCHDLIWMDRRKNDSGRTVITYVITVKGLQALEKMGVKAGERTAQPPKAQSVKVAPTSEPAPASTPEPEKPLGLYDRHMAPADPTGRVPAHPENLTEYVARVGKELGKPMYQLAQIPEAQAMMNLLAAENAEILRKRTEEEAKDRARERERTNKED